MDEKARIFADKLRKRLQGHIIKIYLFCSRARGDHQEYSDYDFVVITDNDNKYIKEIILEVEVEFLNIFDRLAGTIIYNIKDWEKIKNYPLGYNVMKEGVELWRVKK